MKTHGEYPNAMLQRAIVSLGNTARLGSAFDRAAKGENITIAYVGGSITEGYAAGSRSPLCYASLSAAEFEKNYCKGGKTLCRNNGLSGTPSILGNLRVSEEVLSSEPDIIFVEFAVNDGWEEEYKNAYESLVRSCLAAKNHPAVILLFTCLENGYTCQEQQEEIGRHYDLGMISVRDAIFPEIESKRMAWKDYGDDDAHPTVEGHRLIAELIAEYFRKAAAADRPLSYDIPRDCVNPKLYPQGRLFDAKSFSGETGDWKPGTDNERFPAGFAYQAGGENAPLRCTLTGKALFLVYKVSNDKRFGRAAVTVNEEPAVTVSGYDKTGWGGPVTERIAEFPDSREMHVEIKMRDDCKDQCFEIFALGTSGAP